MKHIIIPFYFIFSLLKCFAQESIYNEVVLKTGPVQITKYELEKNLKRAFPAAGENNQTLKKEWIEYYINQTYFLADAYQKGYLDDKRVNYDVTRVGRYMLTQPYGLYEQRILFADLKISEQEILQEYEERSKYLVSYFYFKSLNEMNKQFSNNIPGTKEEFNQAIESHKDLRLTSLFEDTLLCPCQFNEKRIGLDTLQENQVSRPFATEQGVYLFLIKKKGNIPEQYMGSEKKKIIDYLTNQKKDSIRKKHQEQLQKDLSIVRDSNMVKEIVSRIQKDKYYKQNKYAIDKSLFEDMLVKKLFEYTDGKIVKSITLSEFINYYNQCVLQEPLLEQATVNLYIDYFPIEELYYKEALALGMDKEVNYLMDKKNYRNNVISYYYDKDHFEDSIKISDPELIDYYNKNLELFRDSNATDVAAFYFNTIENAQKTIKQTKNIKELTDRLTEFKASNGLIDYNSKDNFSTLESKDQHKISSMLARLPNEQLSRPINIKDQYLVAGKYKVPGVRTYSFQEVKGEIKNIIYQNKFEKMRAQQLSQLKQKFQLISNIQNSKNL